MPPGEDADEAADVTTIAWLGADALAPEGGGGWLKVDGTDGPGLLTWPWLGL